MSDLGFYREGEAIPDGWIITKPLAADFNHGEHLFGCDVEVTFKDGWLRVHAMEKSKKPMLELRDVRSATITFVNDTRFYDADGNLLVEIVHSPGKWTRLS
jgi:hypothetical protein